MRRRATLSLIVAAALLATATRAASQACAGRLPGELSSRCYADFTRWDISWSIDRLAARKAWCTHQDAHADGIPYGARVYGQTLRPDGGAFPSRDRERWMLQHSAAASRVGNESCHDRFLEDVIQGGLLDLLLACECGNPSKVRDSFAVNIEQDSIIPPSSDKDYTMGLFFEWRSAKLDRSGLAKAFAHVDPGGWLHRRYANLDRRHALQFGDSGFTPLKSHLGRSEPLPDDRPYANLLYLSLRRVSANKLGSDADRSVLSEWTVGVLGLGIGRSVQTAIHKASDDIVPGGWNNQIGDGGEPTAKYRLGMRWRLPYLGAKEGWGGDANLSIEGNAGFYTKASAGARLRLGKRSRPWFDYDRTSIASYFSGADREPCQRRRPAEAYAFLSTGQTHWFFNELLQGGFRSSRVRLGWGKEPAPLKHAVSDWQWGVTGTIRGVSLTFSESRHTALFGGVNSRTHRWRTLAVTF